MPTNRISSGDSIRLNRFLALVGIGSRRACDELIAAGRVSVDGRRVTEAAFRVLPGTHRVSVDGSPVDAPPDRLVLLMNKPTGVVSTVSDPMGRPTVLDLCKRFARRKRLFPVGRLDINSSGAILLTNDGLLCYRLTHPQFQIPRIYVTRVRGVITDKKLIRLTRLAQLRTGKRRGRPPVELVKRLGKESVLRITLFEGQNRQVRKMCDSVALKTVTLKRVQFGPVSIRKLPLGAVRPLMKRELDSLDKIISGRKYTDGP